MWSSWPTPAPLQVFVGWTLAAGIVPDHVTWTVWPALSGTVTLSDVGVDASGRTAATTPAAAAAATTPAVATSASTARACRPRFVRDRSMQFPPYAEYRQAFRYTTPKARRELRRRVAAHAVEQRGVDPVGDRVGVEPRPEPGVGPVAGREEEQRRTRRV